MTSANSTKNPEPTRPEVAPKDADQVKKAVAVGKEMMKKGDEVTKVEVARSMYDLIHEESRQVIVQAFIAGAELTPKGAQLHLQLQTQNEKAILNEP